MHVSLVAAAAASLTLGSTQPARNIPPAPVSLDGERCVPLSRHATGERRGSGIWRDYRGGPAVQPYLAVDRRVNGCPVPVIAGAPRR